MQGTFDKLTLITLNPEMHARTCNYWYVVQNQCGPHTAFNRRESLLAWLQVRGLELTAELPQQGQWSCQSIKGAYKAVSHWDYNDVMGRDGVEIRQLSNGQYTLGIVDRDENGIATVHTMNCNCKRRPVYDYAESRAMYG